MKHRSQYWFGSALSISLGFLVSLSNANANIHTGVVEEIVGGTKVSASDPVASSTVLLDGKSDQGEYICTASIISPDTLVTAAHCTAAAPENIRIIFALDVNRVTIQTLKPSQIMPITGYIANPNYKGENYQGDDMGDIAIIHLNGQIPAGYQAAELLQDESALGAGATTLLAGYGITNAYSQAGAGTLRKVDARIQGALGSTEIIIDETSHKGSCSGDSGGPAYIQKGSHYYLWGVTSRGDRNCAQEGIYTNIGSYIDWIKQAETQLRAGK